MAIPVYGGIFPIRIINYYSLFLAALDPSAVISFPGTIIFTIPGILHMLLSIWTAGLILKGIDRLRNGTCNIPNITQNNQENQRRFLPPFFSGAALFCMAFLLAWAYWIFLPFFTLHQPPKIKDGTKLVSECQELITLQNQGMLNRMTDVGQQRSSIIREQWPSSVKELHPLGVFVNNESVTIYTSKGRSVGYMIPYLQNNTFTHIGKRKTVVGNKWVMKSPYPDVYYCWGKLQ